MVVLVAVVQVVDIVAVQHLHLARDSTVELVKSVVEVAVAVELQQHIFEHVRIKAEEDVEADIFKAYGTDPDRLVSPIQKEGMVAIKIATYLQELKNLQGQLSGEAAGGGEDPLVALKKQELDQRAAADQAKMQLDQAKLQLESQKAQQSMQIDQAKLQLQLQRGGRNAA
jgi:hypothetical protein